jgi:hypothetical protein
MAVFIGFFSLSGALTHCINWVRFNPIKYDYYLARSNHGLISSIYFFWIMRRFMFYTAAYLYVN